jgi:dynein heavy chain
VLFVGGTGTGKTVVVTRTLLEGLPERWQNHMMALSSRSSANALQDSLDLKFEKRRKGVFGPPLGHKLAVFVDDMVRPLIYNRFSALNILPEYASQRILRRQSHC